jgi:hypothetical protein
MKGKATGKDLGSSTVLIDFDTITQQPGVPRLCHRLRVSVKINQQLRQEGCVSTRMGDHMNYFEIRNSDGNVTILKLQSETLHFLQECGIITLLKETTVGGANDIGGKFGCIDGKSFRRSAYNQVAASAAPNPRAPVTDANGASTVATAALAHALATSATSISDDKVNLSLTLYQEANHLVPISQVHRLPLRRVYLVMVW